MTRKALGPIEVVVYVANPVRVWQESTSEVLVIYRTVLRRPWVRLARWLARANSGNTGNCGYLIRGALRGEVIEHVPPPAAAAEAI